MSMPQSRSAHLFYGIVDQPKQPRNPKILDAAGSFGTITPMQTMKQSSYTQRYVTRWHALLFLLIALIIGATAPSVHAKPEKQVEFHIVDVGDTWQSISARYLVPVTELWIANGVINPNLLHPNQRLFIPNGST